MVNSLPLFRYRQAKISCECDLRQKSTSRQQFLKLSHGPLGKPRHCHHKRIRYPFLIPPPSPVLGSAGIEDFPPYAIHLTRPDIEALRGGISKNLIPQWYKFLAAFFSWLFLAGFLVLPAIGVSMDVEDTGLLHGEYRSGEKQIVAFYIPFVVSGCVMVGLGSLGILILGFQWRRNYQWIRANLILPSIMNSLAGVLSTFIYTQSWRGRIRNSAAATFAIELGTLVLCMVLLASHSIGEALDSKERRDRRRRWEVEIEKRAKEVGGREMRLDAIKRDDEPKFSLRE